MPPLLNPRHEKAAKLKADGVPNVDAHEQVYGKRSRQAASTLFKRPDIIARVVEIQTERVQSEIDTTEHALKQLGMTKKWWLSGLKANAERCLRGKPIFDSKGKPTGEYTGIPDVHGFNKSMELIGRAMGLFIEKIEVGGPGDFARLSDEELLAKVETDAAALGLPSEATEALMLTFQGNGDGKKDP
jgi:hypothetical protein